MPAIIRFTFSLAALAQVSVGGVVARAEEGATVYVVYAGSIGAGVPKAARERMRKIEDLVASEKERLRLQYRVSAVGLEGERRLCVAIPAGAEGRNLLSRMQALAEGVQLLDLRAAPCPDGDLGR